jgi:fucose 4-O-acetylase-like acetyltransferase
MSKRAQAPGSQEPITSGVRSNAVDIVKGIAIILVVYGHTAQGMQHRNWWSGPKAVFSDEFIYSFHMPAFFFVAGLFAMGSIAKRGSWRFTLEKIKTILYPYLLFAILDPPIEPLIGRFKTSSQPFHWDSFLTSVTSGEASWFLFTLFICLMLALLTKAVPPWLRFSVAALLGLLPLSGPPFLGRIVHEFCFLALGMWVGNGIYRLRQISSTTAAVGFLLLTVFQATMIYRFGAASLWTYIELGVTGTAALFLLSALIEDFAPGKILAWVGRASLAVFLISPYVQGATREILLLIFRVPEFWLQLLLPTFFATLIPAILWHQKERWRLTWLFQWPF